MSKKNQMQKQIQDILKQEQFKWIIIDGNKTDYIISSFGSVISVNKNNKSEPKRLKPWLHKDHLYIGISIDGKDKHFQLHRLVALYFIPNPENKPIVHHIDKDPTNNYIDNLMWVTECEHKAYHKEEIDKIRPEPRYGSDCNFSVYSESQIRIVCKLLSENKMLIDEISKISGVKKDTIHKILSKKQWKKVSDEYPIENYSRPFKNMGKRKSFGIKYNEAQIRKVCELLETGMNYKQISILTGVSKKTIGKIKRKETWFDIGNNYNF